MRRRELLGWLGAGALPGLLPAVAAGAAPGTAIAVWKTPTCGCCGAWVQHLERNGFTARVTVQVDLTPVKAQYGVPERLSSCHTAVVAGYVVEGHVPAADIQRLLAERPRGVTGLVVPGMPAGSPGMEGPVSEDYATLVLRSDGTTATWARHGPGALAR
jgi:hypothetical protein